MTARKDLKRRVRERMAQTGESYTQALEHVRAGSAEAEQAPRKSLIEHAPPTRDLTPLAAREGFTTCSVKVSEPVWDRIEAEEGSAEAWFGSVFEALRRYLVVNIGHRPADTFRSVVVRGAPLDLKREVSFPLQFHHEIAKGERGASPDGRLVALDIPSKKGNVLVLFWTFPPYKTETPQLVININPNLAYADPSTWPGMFKRLYHR